MTIDTNKVVKVKPMTSTLIIKSIKVAQWQIDQMADMTAGAESSDRFASWKTCVRVLYKMGLNDKEVEEVLRSKWMRWAGDGAEKTTYGNHTTADLIRFLETMAKTPEQLKARVKEDLLY